MTSRMTVWHQQAIAFLQANRPAFRFKMNESAAGYDSFGYVVWQLKVDKRVHIFTMHLYDGYMNADGHGPNLVDHDISTSLRNSTKFLPTEDLIPSESIQKFEQYIVERAVKLESKQQKRLNLSAARGRSNINDRIEAVLAFTKTYGVTQQKAEAAFALADKHLPKGKPAARKELADAILMFAS